MPDLDVEATGTTGSDLSWQSPDVPTGRPELVEALRSPGLLWFLAFGAINCVAFGLAMGAHGAGFDDCDGAVMSGEVVLPSSAELAAYGAAAVLLSAVLAVWKLRGRPRWAALTAVAVSIIPWLLVVAPTQDCA